MKYEKLADELQKRVEEAGAEEIMNDHIALKAMVHMARTTINDKEMGSKIADFLMKCVKVDIAKREVRSK